MREPPCVGRMCGCRTFSLVSGLPSRLSAVGCPSLFEPFIGTTPESDSWPACPCPCLRFASSLSTGGARLGVRMGHYSFPVRLFHSRHHAGLSRRTTNSITKTGEEESTEVRIHPKPEKKLFEAKNGGSVQE